MPWERNAWKAKAGFPRASSPPLPTCSLWQHNITQPHLTSSLGTESLSPLHPPHRHTCALRSYLELSGIFHAGGAASQGSSQHIPAWPRERRASSPERPGCSPVGERLGQSQFLYWALDGTDGRKFKVASLRSVAFGTRGSASYPKEEAAMRMRCQQQRPARVSPAWGAPFATALLHPLSIPSCPFQPKCRLCCAEAR